MRVDSLREFNCITLMTESFLFLPDVSSEILERNSTDQTKWVHCPSAANKQILGLFLKMGSEGLGQSLGSTKKVSMKRYQNVKWGARVDG